MDSPQNREVWISKTLSWLLRHGAVKEGLCLSSEGFILVETLLQNKHLKQKCTVNDIVRIVETNDKQRFALRTDNSGKLEIRANQGHSIRNVEDLDLTPITSGDQVKNVIHGTYFQFWRSIKRQGLSRGRRNHIHFAPGLPGDFGVVSGLRKTAEVYIYLDLHKALSAGLKFFRSSNNVILSPGNEQGFIDTRYFLKVENAVDGTVVDTIHQDH